MKTLITSMICVASCSSPPAVPSPRFANAPPVQVVADREATRSPRAHNTESYLRYFDDQVARSVLRPLEVHAPRRAEGVNALDDVPDSTWFTNRIGVRSMTLDELRAGPTTLDNPDRHTPWVIHGMKPIGESLGFVVTDQRGAKFLVKFDHPGFPELETANHIITGRFLWAAGYNVPEDYISHVRATDFVVGDDAMQRDKTGHERKLTAADLPRELLRADVAPDGNIRTMTSRILDGKALGGHSAEGVRPDDPNDQISHEMRRDLRGALPLFAWLDHEDAKIQNTQDMWIEDPRSPGRHYVVHYLLDFGKSLGGMPTIGSDPRPGFEYVFDASPMWGSLVTLGLTPRPYGARVDPKIRGIGAYDINTYNPPAWRPYSNAYVPFLTADRFDWFWGAKIAMQFTPAQIRAIVEMGQLSDPRAVDYLVETLLERQRKAGGYAFSRVSPLDKFAITGGELCFDDLVIQYGLSRLQTTYTLQSYDRSGRPLGSERVQVAAGSHTCAARLPVAHGAGAYTIVEITSRREKHTNSVYVHVAQAPFTHDWHVIGVWRE